MQAPLQRGSGLTAPVGALPMKVSNGIGSEHMKVAGAQGSVYSRSLQDSFGYLQYTDEQWERMRSIHIAQSKRQAGQQSGKGSTFSHSNWEPSFSCAFERRIGKVGDGGKWICDAYRTSELHTCTVISIGSKNDWSFERAIHELNPACRIFTFDHTIAPRNKPYYVTFRQLGLARVNKLDANLTTLHHALESVGLQNIEKIDIFKIDCEGCEYDIFMQVYSVRPVLQQVLMQLHRIKAKTSDSHVNLIFNGLLNNGYVIFHKESNKQHGGSECIEYGFLKLALRFSGGVQQQLGNVATSNLSKKHLGSQTKDEIAQAPSTRKRNNTNSRGGVEHKSELNRLRKYTRIGPAFKLHSEMAKKIRLHQSNKSLPIAHTLMNHRFGLGSCIHVWSQRLCHAMHTGARLKTFGDWVPWADRLHCKKNDGLYCYFTIDIIEGRSQRYIGGQRPPCPSIIYGTRSKDVFRAAAIEYLFAGGLPQFVLSEVEHQMYKIFGRHEAPSNLITVHIRWGDKIMGEMKKVGIDQYVQAVASIVKNRKISSQINVYVATEDPAAFKAFKMSCPPAWNLYCDYMVTEQVGIRPTSPNQRLNHAVMSATKSKGLAGTQSLASLVIAMEANDFVLTTASNWSRIMDELRKNMIDPSCNNCTTMIDLAKNKSPH